MAIYALPVISSIIIWFLDPNFLTECKILANQGHFPLILHFKCRKSITFLLPVCLTYWPRKCIARVDPHDNQHQVWGWNDHPLLSYFVFAADTSHDRTTLTLNSWHTLQVMWSTLPPSLKILCLLVRVISYVSHWIPLKMHKQPLCMHWFTRLVS